LVQNASLRISASFLVVGACTIDQWPKRLAALRTLRLDALVNKGEAAPIFAFTGVGNLTWLDLRGICSSLRKLPLHGARRVLGYDLPSHPMKPNRPS
jgi:hypothetical protein